MNIGSIWESHPVIVVAGLLIIGVTAAYLSWHLFFMGLFPLKKFVQAKVEGESLAYNPKLGFTLADGGEKIEESREVKDE